MHRQTEIIDALKSPFDTPLESGLQSEILSHPPFVNIPGSFNARYLTSRLPLLDDPTSNQPIIREDFIYRSGALAYLDHEGKEAIKQLGIKDIFDLRSEKERNSEPDPRIDGVKAWWYPNTKHNITIIPDTEIQADGTVKVSLRDLRIELIFSSRTITWNFSRHTRTSIELC
jgi:hypothetical protein